jgi:hypothetical protein
MAKLLRKWPSNDRAFLAVAMGYLAALTTLVLFQSPPERVPSIEMLKAAIDRFRQYLEGSKNFDRVQIALRKKARAEVIALFDKVFHFLESVADDDDAIQLQQAGFELRKTVLRKKSSKKNARSPEQEGVVLAGG